MASEPEPNPKVEIAHVLSMDLVGYSLLLITDQTRVTAELTEIVKNTRRFREADAEGKLMRIPTGDGMSLLFFDDPQGPLECAMEIATALKAHPDIQLRMGIHSGPVNEVIDVSDRRNVAGAGIDMAQRVMDCGDAGHILLSKRVADDLAPFPRWRPHLHDPGECLVKHGQRLHLFNFFNEAAGNPALPSKSGAGLAARAAPGRSRLDWRIATLFGLLLLSLGGVVWWFAARPAKPIPAVSRTQTASVIPKKSVAILPFENLSSEKENAYFAEGVQAEILTRLARIADLKVISHTSTQHYQSAPENLPEIARQLGVANIVEGSVQKNGTP